MTLTPSRVNQGLAGTSAWPITFLSVPTIVEKQDQTANVATTWTSATALNTSTATYAATGYGTANVGLRVPTTTTAGAVTIEVSQDGTDWTPAGAVRQDNSFPENPVLLPYWPGTNGTRIYAFSIDAFTLIRVRLSTVIVGAGNVVVTISAVAGGIEPIVATRNRKVATYSAVFRTTTRPYQIAKAFTANTRVQFATIHHAAAAVRTVRLRRVAAELMLVSGAGAELNFDLVRITTAPTTPAPAITPSRADTADAVAEVTCMALPGVAGTEEAQVYESFYANMGVTGAASVANPPPVWNRYEFVDPTYDEAKLPTIRAGVLEGWALTIDSTAASTVWARVRMEFTEEPG